MEIVDKSDRRTLKELFDGLRPNRIYPLLTSLSKRRLPGTGAEIPSGYRYRGGCAFVRADEEVLYFPPMTPSTARRCSGFRGISEQSRTADEMETERETARNGVREREKRAGRRSTSRIKKLINKEEEFSRPALEPPFGLHPLRRSTVSRTLCVSANVPADTCCSVAPSTALSKRETEKRKGTKEWGGNWRHSLDCSRRRLSRVGLAPSEFDGRFTLVLYSSDK